MKFASIKSATVAIAKVDNTDRTIFDIVGSGVCIDHQGIILTCEHVISAFMAVPIQDQVKGIGKSEEPKFLHAPPMFVPYAIFYQVGADGQLFALQCRVDQIVASTEQDIGALRVLPDPHFPNGYPIVDLEEYSEIHEGLEVGTCGFPLGNFLQKQIGAVTSSFTFGRISTISPYAGVEKESVKAFQLDVTATHGNSGGPVFNQASSKIIGVLQGGILHPSGSLQAGLTRCEPAYKFLSGNEVEFMKSLPLGKAAGIAEMKKLGRR